MVLRVCQRVLHHAQDAEDAFQATFLVLARKAASIGKSESLASWLYGVAYRIALRARRDAGRRRVREARPASSPPSDPAETLAWRDVQVLLEAEIERLPRHYRSAFVLCFLEGRSRMDAAAELGIPENTLSSRLARARERLQKRLARRGVNLSAVLAAVAITADATEATVPTALFESTARTGLLFALRHPVTGVSSFTLQLTHGAIQTMATAKMKWAFGMLAVAGTLAVGTWGVGQVPGRGETRDGTDPTSDRRETKPAAVERVADYAQRQRSLNNLKRIAQAMQKYYDAHDRFPTDVTDKNGKPLLSWRVQLLPYLEQDHFHKQFNLNESWDSEHNLKLLSRMPDVFRVGFEPKDATHTYYQRFAIAGALWGTMAGPGYSGGSGSAAGSPDGGAGPMFPGPGGPPAGMGAGPGTPGPSGYPAGMGSESADITARFPLRLAEVTDGTSNTLAVIEAGPPVPWTKPADIAYHSRKPLPVFVGPFANVRNAATLDGSVHGLRPNLDEITLRRLIEPNDGSVLPAVKTLRARFPADTEEEKKALARLLEQNQALIAALEEQISEYAALLALNNKLTRDLDRAEEEQDRLKKMVNDLKAMNKKLRDDLGLRRGAGVPKGK
jgi:RNA polymerase sigma factor (sigma-70 family)